MQTIHFLFLISILSFINVYASEMPQETAVLQLPASFEADWKEITHYVNKEEGTIEVIPLNQTIQNWSALIAIQYMDSSNWDKAVCSLDVILDYLRKEFLSSYPEETVTWQILEKDEKGVIYEWMLHKPHKGTPIQHEVSRAFFTPSGFHRVGITRKNRHMNPEERTTWIKLLRENTSVVPFQQAKTGISLVEKLQYTVSLGSHFQGWATVHYCTLENGYSIVYHTPPQSESNECLVVTTMPNITAAPLTKLVNLEKQCIREKISPKVEFHTLEHSPNEIIYTYHYPKDDLQLNALVRAFLTDHGYYSISYKKRLEGPIPQDELTNWQAKLKSILVI